MSNKDKTIENQANVIRDIWGQLDTLRKTLIHNYPQVWDEIKRNDRRLQPTKRMVETADQSCAEVDN